jgi:alkylation response protein AidB-like acyl-CoA dehydrogenase
VSDSQNSIYTPEVEVFRLEVRHWLEENLPTGWLEEGYEQTTEQQAAFSRDWRDTLYKGGWICASWPKEYGGRGLSTLESVVLTEEFVRARAPLRADFFGDTLVGPTILQWGNEEQKSFFIPRILRGEIAWCQGFSEPDAGSDLASVRTRAELDGDEWVINGQKIWTTRAQDADYIFLLTRTDPTSPKHQGLSYLVVPMDQPGVQVRPIIQLDGAVDFNEVFFENARAPKDWVIGPVHGGWKVAMTTLGFERGGSSTTSYRRFQKELDQIIESARINGKAQDPLIRQKLVRQWSRVQIIRLSGLRTLSDVLNGTKQAAALGPLNKLMWSETHRDTMRLAIEILGMEGQVLSGDASEGDAYVSGYGLRELGLDYSASPIQRSFFFSIADTVGGGTSEIQRNVVGERFLGLPKEPQV